MRQKNRRKTARKRAAFKKKQEAPRSRRRLKEAVRDA
jgi:hypothetical protein